MKLIYYANRSLVVLGGLSLVMLGVVDFLSANNAHRDIMLEAGFDVGVLQYFTSLFLAGIGVVMISSVNYSFEEYKELRPRRNMFGAILALTFVFYISAANLKQYFRDDYPVLGQVFDNAKAVLCKIAGKNDRCECAH